MNQADRLALIRANAIEVLALDSKAVAKTGTGEFILATPEGFAKVKVSGIKDETFDPKAEQEAYEADLAVKQANAEARAKDREAKKRANIAKKARTKASKGE